MKEVFEAAETKMNKTVNALINEYAAIRAGRANPAILDKIAVDYYGVPTPVNQMAAIKTPDAHTLVIEPWDKSSLGAIEAAIMNANLGVNPNNDGQVIRLPFPSLTEERRKELAKQCKTYAEEARIAIRNARRDANTEVEKSVKEDNLPEDEKRRAEEEIQKLTDSYVAKIDDILKKKEDEVMTV